MNGMMVNDLTKISNFENHVSKLTPFSIFKYGNVIQLGLQWASSGGGELAHGTVFPAAPSGWGLNSSSPPPEPAHPRLG